MMEIIISVVFLILWWKILKRVSAPIPMKHKGKEGYIDYVPEFDTWLWFPDDPH